MAALGRLREVYARVMVRALCVGLCLRVIRIVAAFVA